MNHKIWIICLGLSLLLSACGSSGNESAAGSFDGSGAFTVSEENLTPPAEIDTRIADLMVEEGYTVEHASKIQEILNALGIEGITIKNHSGAGAPEEGLWSIICYPDGYEQDKDHSFYFTTEDGVLFYASFNGEDLYDSSKGGYLKSYGDVHIPEKEITVDVYEQLRTLATEEVKSCLNYPDTASFSMLDWGIGRSDDNYKIVGSVTAANGLGVEDDIPFSVWFVKDGDGFITEGVTLNGFQVK